MLNCTSSTAEATNDRSFGVARCKLWMTKIPFDNTFDNKILSTRVVVVMLFVLMQSYAWYILPKNPANFFMQASANTLDEPKQLYCDPAKEVALHMAEFNNTARMYRVEFDMSLLVCSKEVATAPLRLPNANPKLTPSLHACVCKVHFSESESM